MNSKASHDQKSSPDSTSTVSSSVSPNPEAMFIPIRSSTRPRAAHGYGINSQHVDYFSAEKYKDTKRLSHEHKGILPAVAALLAVTAIPKKGQHISRARKPVLDVYVVPSTPVDSSPRLEALLLDDQGEDSGMIFGSFNDNEQSTISRTSSCTALSLLLSPPEDYDDKDFCSLSVRSASSESVPGLETDDAASAISWSDPATPKASLQRSNIDRKTRMVSAPPEDCVLDHPLLFESDKLEEPLVAEVIDSIPRKKQGFRNVLSFKSNLTASLRVLRSAAMSISSFSAPLIQPDDLLTRSILSNNPRYPDERRPRPSEETPTPALRRYLNPLPTCQDNYCTGAIQMQTYNRVRRSSRQKSRTIPPPRTDEGDTPRPREPRENSNFLRIIVLEMSMRREGKLSDTAHGRARLVLPPRQASKTTRVIGDLAGRWEVLSSN